MTITHICMSDMHFGAETSLLTELDQDFRPRYGDASPVVLRLIECLRAVVATQPQAPRPTLVLAGDILELALSHTNQAAMAFEKFLSLAFPGGGQDLFAREIVYVPGNHDHHLWEAARETHYLDYLGTVPPGESLGEEWHVTRLYRKDGTGWPVSRLLTGLATRHPSLRDLHVATAYPNMGLRSPDGERSVVFTHGHYVEPLYTLMTELKCMLFPEDERALSVAELEAENFAWVDFFWSTMGRSGMAGDAIQKIYEMNGTEDGRKKLIERLSDGIVERFFSEDWWPDWAQRKGLASVFEIVARRATARERSHTSEALGASTEDGLKEYVSGPLRRQIEHESRHSHPPKQVTVVFGHTHKPFERSLTLDGFAKDVDVLNTGGWVVDTVERQALHGAAIVLVDEDCNCASLRMYNEADDGGPPPPVRVSAAQPNPLHELLQQQVDPAKEPWSGFTEVARTGIDIRGQALKQRIGS